MRRNSNKSKRLSTPSGVFNRRRSSGTGDKKANQSNSFIGTFPRSPSRKGKSKSVAASPDPDSPLSTVESSENGSSITNETAAVPSASADRRDDRTDAGSANRKSVLSPVNEDRTVQSSPAKAKSVEPDGGGAWLGTGFDGEALALSDPTLPDAINFQRFQSDDLPVVEEHKIAAENNGKFLRERTLASRVRQDVEDLSVDLSVLEDVDSICSVMTRDNAVDLAKRLERMERQLLQSAGETGKVDAMRALANAADRQARKTEHLQRKARRQSKQITTLNDLCERLLDRRKKEDATRPTTQTQREIDELRNESDGLALELHRSESRNEEMAERLRRSEEDNAKQKSRLRSHGRDRKASAQLQEKLDALREESRRRAAKDEARIRKLESEITTMAAAHARSERRSNAKIEILVEIKTAMEEQIHLLEGNDDSSMD